jgi:hypothetical protein
MLWYILYNKSKLSFNNKKSFYFKINQDSTIRFITIFFRIPFSKEKPLMIIPFPFSSNYIPQKAIIIICRSLELRINQLWVTSPSFISNSLSEKKNEKKKYLRNEWRLCALSSPQRDGKLFAEKKIDSVICHGRERKKRGKSNADFVCIYSEGRKL